MGASSEVSVNYGNTNADPRIDNFFLRMKSKMDHNDANKEIVDNYMDYWTKDKKDLTQTEEGVAKRRKEATTLTNNYYDMVTDLYEYGMCLSNQPSFSLIIRW